MRFMNGLQGHKNWVRSAEFSPDGRLVVLGGDDRTVRMWDIRTNRCIIFMTIIAGQCTKLISSKMAPAWTQQVLSYVGSVRQQDCRCLESQFPAHLRIW